MNSSGYISDDGKRTAEVKLVTVPMVEFYENGKLIKTITYNHHNLQYAEDAAENYVMGIFKIDE